MIARARISNGRGEAARRRFLDAAAELFADRGYHATSIRDIARAIEVTPGAVYAHFPSKGRLLLAVYEAGVDHMCERLDAEGRGDDPWDRLEGACARHLEALFDAGGYGRVVIRVLPRDEPEVETELAGLRERYERRFRDLVTALDLAPGVDPGVFRLTLLGALNWSLVWYRAEDGAARQVAGQLIRSLRFGAAASR